jgi:hypothetical protein
MATYTKIKLSGSSDGRGIAVASTNSSSPTVIHDTNDTDEVDEWDEVWLWVTNNDILNADEFLTIYWGDTLTRANSIEENITVSQGLKLVVPGFILHSQESISAWGNNDPSALTIFGYVNRIT